MNTSTRTHSNPRIVTVLLTAAVCAGFVVSSGRPAFAACGTTPAGEVLVMSNNVYEVDKKDARNSGDMKRFVERIKEMAPDNYAPDVVLIQEAKKSAVGKIKNFLENKFGCANFSIPVNASKRGWDWIREYWKLGGQDTAVIVNTKSMKVHKKGYIAHDYARSNAANGESVKVKKTAWAHLTEKAAPNGRPLNVLVASAHFPRTSDFKNESTSEQLKKKFAVNIAKKLNNVKADGAPTNNVIHVIGGDMNNPRFEGSPNSPTPLFSALTTAPWNYVDGPIQLYQGGNPNPIDFLFSTGQPLKAEMDKNNTHDESARNFYSNHDLRWSLLAPY